MLYLYIKPHCPYCLRVQAANDSIKAPLVLVDISADSAARELLIEKGGKPQVPFLEDTERGIQMYESADIIDYLQTHYGNDVAPDLPPVQNVCPID